MGALSRKWWPAALAAFISPKLTPCWARGAFTVVQVISARLTINLAGQRMTDVLGLVPEQAERRGKGWSAEQEYASFGRLWRAFMTARVLIAVVLVALQSLIYYFGNVPDKLPIVICSLYLVATLAVRVLSKPRPPSGVFDAQWLLTIGVDVLTFTALNFLQSSSLYYTPLFALPVLLASVLGPLLLALGTAASVTIFLLVDAWRLSSQVLGDTSGRFLQAGLSGSGFFAVALLANQLALRLAREEQLAKASQAVARTQTEVNELIVETLTDGVLVIDANGIVRSANPVARRLLTTREVPRVAPFVLAVEPAWQPLVEIMSRTMTQGQQIEADVNLIHAGSNARRLRVRTRLANAHDSRGGALCVMFLEDLREVQARVRVEKMAAMGRMSAAVAHEIRNPLAAISQANALLAEDLLDVGQLRLTEMVQQNVQRLSKIVDDILNVSRVQVVDPEQLQLSVLLDAVAARITNDWVSQTASSHLVHLSLAADNGEVIFDPEHLRRVLINLLDNALRYVKPSPQAIQIETRQPQNSPARLTVWSNGEPIEKTVEAHLFEPFFSSESRSSGLGLYICRELCERYGALIGYQRAARQSVQGNEFFVIFKTASLKAVAPGGAADDLFS